MSNVLIIDSTPADHEELVEHLSHVGHTCQRITGGSEGLALARENPPELIILAVELERVSGYAICNKFKKDPGLKEVPLILVSAQATPGDFAQHQKLKTHADGYVHKPYSLEHMVGLLGRHISSEEDEDIDIGDVDATMAISVADLEQALATRADAASPKAKSEELDIDLDLDLDVDLDVDLDDELEGDFSALLQEANESEEAGLSQTPEVLIPDAPEPAPEPASEPEPEPEPGPEPEPEPEPEPAPEPAPAPAPEPAPEPEPEPEPAPEPAPEPEPEPAPEPETDDIDFNEQAAAPRATDIEEIQGLRARIRELEANLEEREMEFSERLLDESTRNRETVELRNRVNRLEHENRTLTEAQSQLEEEVAAGRDEKEAREGAADKEAQHRETLQHDLAEAKLLQRNLEKERDELNLHLEQARKDALAGTQRAEKAEESRDRVLQSLSEAAKILSDSDLERV